LALVFLAMIMVFSAGLAAIFATVQVYFRDTSSFLPYFIRIWLYLSPVLFLPSKFEGLLPWVYANPLYSLLGGYTELLVRSQMPDWHMWLAAFAWSMVSVVFGFGYLMSRERDFAVRI
jgi:teichoic acid transport system permease protein